MLGFCVDASNEKKRARAPREFAAFRDLQLSVEKAIGCPEFSALCRFLESWNPVTANQHPELQFLSKDKITGFGAFRIAGAHWLHDTPRSNAGGTPSKLTALPKACV